MRPREADTVGSQPLTLLRCSARSRGAVVVRPPLKWSPRASTAVQLRRAAGASAG